MTDAEPILRLRRLHPERDADLDLPRYMTPQSAGMDLCAAVAQERRIDPGEVALIPTGFAMALPVGYEAQIRPRSGLAVRHGVTVVNAPGTVDADYRGEVCVALINLGRQSYTLRRGDRIAQMIVQRVCRARMETVAALDDTDRGDGGFGHTGK